MVGMCAPTSPSAVVDITNIPDPSVLTCRAGPVSINPVQPEGVLMPILLSSIDLVVSATFTIIVAAQWVSRPNLHSLLWAWALLVWTLAVAAETAAALNGAWTPFAYRVYYAFGALMVAAWLGAGSLHLSASPRWARVFTWVVAALSIVGAALIFTYPIDPALLGQVDSLGFVEVKVFPFIPVRIFVVIANIMGSVAFIGAAAYSLWSFRRRHDVPSNRVTGVSLIALGGLVAAAAHSLGALGGPGLFRVTELVAVVLIFAGYLLSTRRATAPVSAAVTA